MTTVTIRFDDGRTHDVQLSGEAMEAVRFSFNPSAIHFVDVLKALAAAHISAVKELQVQKPEAGRELAVAVTQMQTASMWAVLGATKGL